MSFKIQDKNIKNRGNLFLFSILVAVACSCNPTKYVPADETLFDDYKINISRESVKKSELVPYLKQKPNKRIFGIRFHLGVYNLSNLNKEKWPHTWLRNIGEEPSRYDPYSTLKSKEQIGSYLSSKGYFDNRIDETVETANRRTKVYFDIKLKSPYIIRDVSYEIQDPTIRAIVFADSIDRLFRKGDPYDETVLKAEQTKMERIIRDLGFYNFSGDNVYFRIDSAIGNRQVDIIYGVDNELRLGPDNVPRRGLHTQFRVRNVYIYPDYIPRDFLSGGDEFRKGLDTVEYNGYYFITNIKKPTIKYHVITQSLYIRPGTMFNVSSSENSQSHLLSLKTYRLVNIMYNESPKTPGTNNPGGMLDCNIQLTPMSRQSFSWELEGTNSGGNLGGALNFIYLNKNLFRGAEQFNLKLKGAYETFSQSTTGIRSTREFGAETGLRIPKFLIPFLERENFIRKYNPSTTIQFAYNYQNLPVYTRTVANATFGYQWSGNEYTTHMVSPLQMNLVKIPVIDAEYRQTVIEKSSYLINSYKDVLIAGGSYSYIFSNQKMKKTSRYWFLRINAEASGNILRQIMKLSGREQVTDSISSHFNILGQPFAQFVRTDIDLRYTKIINEVSSIVYRGFIGVGIPYGNSVAMPFEKQYFEGGANGIRGWQVRSLGPGSYYPPEAKFINQTGDIKLEANIEYRFKLPWILEGALFVDAGNIWAVKEDLDRPGAQFRFNKFIDDVAIGSGIGLRLDLKFVILRTDLGFKIRDPKHPADERWLFTRPGATLLANSALVIAIGYPF
ncbi:MAG: BamA/TamA family outer membrane protein [Bacteroidales bacterium]